MNVTRIVEILRICVGQVGADNQPVPGTELVEVWIEIPLKTREVHAYAAEMASLLSDWPDSVGEHTIPPLGGDIAYPLVGAVLNGQNYALLLFAFGKLLGWWDIHDPTTMMGLEKADPVAQRMADTGMISIHGFRPQTM